MKKDPLEAMGQEKIKIKVTIAGRIYQLNVGMEEEEFVRRAAEQVDERIRELQSSYAVGDQKDLLAMAALEMGTERYRLEKGAERENEQALERMEEMKERIDEYLRTTAS